MHKGGRILSFYAQSILGGVTLLPKFTHYILFYLSISLQRNQKTNAHKFTVAR